jgi:hypothetical protein
MAIRPTVRPFDGLMLNCQSLPWTSLFDCIRQWNTLSAEDGYIEDSTEIVLTYQCSCARCVFVDVSAFSSLQMTSITSVNHFLRQREQCLQLATVRVERLVTVIMSQ